MKNRFVKLKINSVIQTFLVHPNFEKPFILISNASNKAIGHVLWEKVDGELRPIFFGGRVLSDTEQRYSITDRELLSVYFAVKKCEFYLVGHKFVIYTDHKPLILLKTFRALVHKRICWINYLQILTQLFVTFQEKKMF